MDQSHSSPVNIFLSIFMLLGGCLTNNLTLEYILYKDASCGSLLTICQFLVIILQGTFGRFDFKTFTMKERSIPILFHIAQVVLFFGSTITSNIAYGYHISLPLMNLFRSGSLAMNLIVGMLLFGLK
jgi:solute carrier family 35 (UDP-xylose/UDP-N-acetylglucosamine transporter), member B4